MWRCELTPGGQDVDHLFLVMDFYNGGDLATLLARWGRLGRDRARFYAAEISAGVQGLHAAGVVYRDLKPENVLIAADGHVVLTDFGLSRQFPREHEEGSTARKRSSRYERETTTTFCGTSEYLAPEVLLGEPYSYEVDWWSFGTMLCVHLAIGSGSADGCSVATRCSLVRRRSGVKTIRPCTVASSTKNCISPARRLPPWIKILEPCCEESVFAG